MPVIGYVLLICVIVMFGGLGLLMFNRVSTLEPCPSDQVQIVARNGIFCVTGASARSTK